MRGLLQKIYSSTTYSDVVASLLEILKSNGHYFFIPHDSHSGILSFGSSVSVETEAKIFLRNKEVWPELEFSESPLLASLSAGQFLLIPLRLVDPSRPEVIRLCALGAEYDGQLNDLTIEQLTLIDAAVFIARTLSRLDAKEIELERDSVTGLLNSRSLKSRIKAEIARSERFSGQFSLLFIDLDNFKQINDRFGHLAGTSLLSQTAELLRQDSREIDAIFRYGGDEFIVLLVGADAQSAFSVAERIRDRIDKARFFLEDGHHLSITASIGVASYPRDRKSVDDLIRLADEMMYNGKKAGKNRVSILNS